MTQPASKAQARAQAKAQRITMDAIARLDASAAIRNRLLEMPEVHEADTIFAYVSMQDEVATHKLLDQLLEQGKTVAVPVVIGEEIVPHLLHDLEDLYPDRFDIPAPQTRVPLDLTPDVTIVPGLAFTPAGQRLGRGGGYYDRYLTSHPETSPIAVCFENQILDALPTEATDFPVPVIVTEKRLIRVE
ncbi:5-formyltetrahydrofolate cyclo-ligase [Mucisphaera calidilacus]|uniref:5-formyltetrahydrofolate cyclo-ligase n=1 Tax=Mucisphaera calidilacus TaxID=2527982 RepID=A0A518BZ03_9BACT|nr:5-formyltetrahydrofolate cyclo-ligase [Mucisphaera calidilacus]QDU72198.1 5-formyltetrahydrofolate cyclo-ligase family protein [Mucisphaera calidilacus]